VSFSDYFLSTLGVYGVPALFAVLLVGSVGVPMPATLLLLVAGSFVAQGELNLWLVLVLASAGAIIGDNIGYGLGRWGGERAARTFSRLFGGERQLKHAEDWLRRWEGAGVFLTRWLFTPLGPLVNLTSGATRYPWPRFLLYDVLGEALWVVLYVLLGKFFSGSVQLMSEFFGDFTWMIVGLLFVLILGWQLVKLLRAPDQADVKTETSRQLFDNAS
jgi:membrane protein DedA with SNARE-associated domain